ncbi:putative secreted protein/putative hemolysin [Methanofollis sp. W23]|uniref:protease inhibitor I42 family protein n=1 Tax=Methanofollis sp. W23 TaxID=2817849 RepID=UPI001AE974BA|nr:protease inhibitor I42 family protein [Methanofollis sp. W23]MBP2146136.1 putative secreted protein/putative hemolysin [Methanofollis sp. W23]
MNTKALAGAVLLVLAACLIGAGCTSADQKETPQTTPVPETTTNETPAPTPTENETIGMPNPAAVWCEERGYGYEIRTDADGNEHGVCIFENGTEMDAWEVYRAAMTTPDFVFNETADNTSVEVAAGSIVQVDLRENPTTGYEWNATLSDGLNLINDTYTTDPHPEGMVGVGGTRTWLLEATCEGDQTFSAIYTRPWENTTGTEENFTLALTVVPTA